MALSLWKQGLLCDKLNSLPEEKNVVTDLMK